MQDSEQVILITGGAGGIGSFCTQDLARQRPNALIVIASRSEPRGTLPANVHFKQLDLLSRTSIRSFVSSWSYGRVTGLVCNAGLNPGGLPPAFVEGIETALFANHLGHALLFFLLNHKELLSTKCRLTIVGSGTHDPMEPLNPSPAKWTDTATVAAAVGPDYRDGNVRYSTSKVASIMFGMILSEKAKAAGKNFKIVSFDPGFCPGNGSELTRHQPGPVRFMAAHVLPHILWLLRAFGMCASTPEKSGHALAMLSLGTETTGTAISGEGEYYQVTSQGFRQKPSSEATYLAANQADLWEWTIQESAVDAEEKNAFSRLA